MKAKRTALSILFIFLFIALSLAPLGVMLIQPRPRGREFLLEMSVALGFVGLAMMALQFALTARIKYLKAPFGSDIVYQFHRQISLVTFALIALHPLLLFIQSAEYLKLLNLLQAPWRARAAVGAFTALIVMIAISIWRKQLKIGYTRWRIWHGLLAVLAVALAMTHVILVNHYLNTPAKRILWIVYAGFWVGTLIYVRLIKPLMLLRRPYRVEQVIEERGSAWSLVLRPVGHAGMRFQPGQFAWITLRSSPFDNHRHPFSFSSSAEQPDRLTFTIKDLGDFTREIKTVQPGELVYVDGPFGGFSSDRQPQAAGYTFIAGGIGITPMMSMLRTMADRGESRPLTLIYANRFWEAATFREEIEALKSRLNLRVVPVLEKPPAGWQGESGFINREALQRHLPTGRERDQHEIYLCGPEPMMNAVEKALFELGFHYDDVHSERFNMV